MITLREGVFFEERGVEISGLTLAQGLRILQTVTPGYTLESDQELAAILAHRRQTLSDLHRDCHPDEYVVVVPGTKAEWEAKLASEEVP